MGKRATESVSRMIQLSLFQVVGFVMHFESFFRLLVQHLSPEVSAAQN